MYEAREIKKYCQNIQIFFFVFTNGIKTEDDNLKDNRTDLICIYLYSRTA